MTTDTSFLRDIYISVRCHLKTSTKPIYFYKMTLETELNIFKKLIGIKVPGNKRMYEFVIKFNSDYRNVSRR